MTVNREQRRKADKGMKKLDIHAEASRSAQTLLDASGVILRHLKGGENPSHFEVLGLATKITNEVFEEVTKQLSEEVDGKESSDQTDSPVPTEG